MSMSYSTQNEIQSNNSWNNREAHRMQHFLINNSNVNNNHRHNNHNGGKDRYKSTHSHYISYRRDNSPNNNQFLSPPNRYRRPSSKYHKSRDHRSKNSTFHRHYSRDKENVLNKSRIYDKDYKSRRNMKDSDEEDSSTFSFHHDDTKQNHRKNNNKEVELETDSNNSSTPNVNLSTSNVMNADTSENDDDDDDNDNNFQLPLTDDTLISDDDEEDTMNTRTVSISKSKSLMRLTSLRRRGLTKLRTGSRSCGSNNEYDNQDENDRFTPKAHSVYTPKHEDDNKFFENENEEEGNRECIKCNSYKSELNILKGVGISSLSMDNLMNLEKELLTSLSRIQSAINDKYRNEKLCIVCQNNLKNCVFRPCGHFSTCAVCSRQLGKCPICMSTIDDKFKIYQ